MFASKKDMEANNFSDNYFGYEKLFYFAPFSCAAAYEFYGQPVG